MSKTERVCSYIGVDAGGTSTRSVHISCNGELLGSARGGASNPSVGLDESLGIVRDVIIRVLHADVSSCVSIAVALSGGESESFCAYYRDALSKILSFEHVLHVTHDALAPAALLLPPLIDRFLFDHVVVGALITGTGSVSVLVRPCIERTEEDDVNVIALRTTKKCGGWGPTVGDKGSAHFVCIYALTKALECRDGMHENEDGAWIELLQSACIYFCNCNESVQTLSDEHLSRLVRMLGKRPDAALIAGFAERVHELARKGNRIAAEALHEAGRELGRLVKACLIKDTTVNFLVTGGVLNAWDLIKNGLACELTDAKGAWRLFSTRCTRLCQNTNENALGAARIAAMRLGSDTLYDLTKYLHIVPLLSADTVPENTI